jgi:hypothetical protein
MQTVVKSPFKALSAPAIRPVAKRIFPQTEIAVEGIILDG